MIKFRRLGRGKTSHQLGSESLKGLFKQIEAIGKSLISRQARKPRSPIICNKIIDLTFVEFLIEMSEKSDCHEFLIGKTGIGIITCTLETSFRAGYRKFDRQTDKVELVDYP